MKHYIAIPILLFVLSFSVFAQKIDRSKAPEPGPAPVINIGEYHSFTLDNGLKVFVVENHKIPKVSYSLIIDKDPVFEGVNAGYVSLAGDVLGTATTSKSKDQIDTEVDFIGASLRIGASSAYATSLKKHNEKLMDLFSDVILNAKFTEEELDKAKKQMISGLKASKNDPNSLSNMLNNVILYGNDHPYGEMISEESIQSVTLEMLQNYYDTYYKPNIAYMAIVGDINPDEAEIQMKKYFGEWQKSVVPENNFDKVNLPETRKVVIKDRPEAVQSVLKVTHPVQLNPGDEDLIKVRVMNTILGGGTYRLFDNLREKHGWTYGAYSSLSSDKLVGRFMAYAEVGNAVTDSSVNEILYEIKRIQDEPVPEDELLRVKNYITGNFALSLERPETVAGFALNIARYDLDKEYYKNYLKNIAAVTPDDISTMAKKYLHPDNCYIFIVGKSEEIENSLKKFTNNDILFIDEDGNYIMN